jgi:hypothetical protein
LKEIEEQMELGDAGLLDEDHWMLEVNLGDLETNNGEQAEYWLLAMIRAGRMAYNKGGTKSNRHAAAGREGQYVHDNSCLSIERFPFYSAQNPCTNRVVWLSIATEDSGP